MRKIFLFLFLLQCVCSIAQVNGGFTTYNDGHIYFQALNQTTYTISVKIVAKSNDRENSEFKTLAPGEGFYLGPSTPWHWYWKAGDRLTVIYQNGQSVYWDCNRNDPSYNSNQPSFKQVLWYGEGTPPGYNSDGYIKSGSTTKKGNYTYHIYKKNGSQYVYDKQKGWCSI